MTYQRCFVGIPLSDDLTPRYQGLISSIRRDFPDLRPDGGTETPHITLYYLGNREESDFARVLPAVEQVRPVLHGTTIKAGGLGRFVWEQRVIFFVTVESSSSLQRANRMLQGELAEFRAPENHDTYLPHLTIARGELAKTGPLDEALAKRFALERWEWPVTRLGLYGTPPGGRRELLREILV